MLSYPVTLTPDSNGSILVTFPDVPEAITIGETVSDALVQALDALEAALAIYRDEKRSIPMPSKALPGQPVVTLTALTLSKVFLVNEIIGRKVRAI
ncbi:MULTISPECIES: type II toxin-antitoxin system HicB family antitoxin [unclassified Burkholderia]|uniref:type II toxin-antitoxin system HicB family antitoxin n=1 Tax=unclassified Burkholderia TaxID=2613784 RepID=UPI001421A69F|nr:MULTISPECIES: type II toxin-antitoxin system HicB family antitoxin [unclassified Burkholderia]NIE84101.1 type II toxin-antitoxin system HicB family antitoxin [Burkholderia sp. Tr-860]NIF62492.1 type II toxin-antitoxin system HicB family antitoxin [Burkholderia sp. Cy-647]NIF70636.1 type II toxin-antitoxin system HicB family antitoxin [Burkholderia sp. Ap-962]NIF98149.1 type II toxin-antitoxin system HicB family antitoxin [Burkholderia sp. Ax-1720]